MAKMMGPRFKQCRRLGLNVCGHPKAMDRAERGTSRADKKLSPYGTQLLEKQRLKAYYGVLEKQFANYVHKAEKSKELKKKQHLKRLRLRKKAAERAPSQAPPCSFAPAPTLATCEGTPVRL